MPALQIRDLTIGHGHGHQTDDGLWLGVLIQNLTITINSGQLVWVSGENGIGKTTFLRTLAGLHKPWSGKSIWVDETLSDQNNSIPSDMNLPPCHYLGPKDGFHGARILKDELDFQVALMGGTTSSLNMAIEILGLETLLALPVNHLSSGQRQRAAFTRILACHRPIWLLDEPLTALDTKRRTLITSLIESHQKSGGIIMVSGHDNLIDAFGTPLHRLTLKRNPEAWDWQESQGESCLK